MYRTSEKTSLSRKMAELENRWRKSQEDRYILEVKFKEVLKGLANKNEVNKLLKIREKYNHFLVNEDARNERNDRILRTLDKIESQANMLSAKTERLKLLKLHYEAYMKRMYPTWEKDANNGVIMVNKDLVYCDSRKRGQSNVRYSTRPDEMATKNDNSMLPYTPRQSEKFYATSNGLQRESVNAPQSEPLPIYHMSDVNPRLSAAENTAVQRFNPEFPRGRMYSEEKTTTSHGPSFEQEENTSKDLLNVSLSDDYMIHDGTAPVDTGKGREGKKDADFQLNMRGAEAEAEKVPLYRNSMNGSYIHEMPVNNQVEYVGSDEIPNSADKMYTNVPCDDESPVAVGTVPELQPNVVVTSSTPDFRKSSFEDDMNGRGIVTEDKSKRSGYVVTHENSGPTSEAEDIPSEESGVDRNKVKEVTGVEQSPRPTTSLEHNQGNVEEPFMFSSSDADYDELENQMAALVEGKRSDKSQSKPFSQSGHNSAMRDELVDSGEAADSLGNDGDKLEISTGITEKETYQQEDGNGDVSNNEVENDPDGNNLETVEQTGDFQETVPSSEEERALPARENMDEPEGAESYDALPSEEMAKEEESVYYARPYEELENSTVNAMQGYDEMYNRQDTVEGDASGGEGIVPDDIGRYYEESQGGHENDSNTSYDKEGVYHDDSRVKSTEGSEADLGNNAVEVKHVEEEEVGNSDHDENDVDVGFQAEQPLDDSNNFERYGDETQRDDTVDEPGGVEVGDAQSGGDREDEGSMLPEHEPQEETWEEKGEVRTMVQEGYHQPEGQSEEVTVGVNEDYVTDQDVAENTYGTEVAEGGDKFEGTANESDDRVHEAVEIQGDEDSNQVYASEGQNELHERQDEGREPQGERETPEEYVQVTTEEEKMTTSEENYVQDVMEPEAGEYEHSTENVAVESSDSPDGSHVQERVSPEVDQERSQHESDIHGESEMVAEAYEDDGRKNLEENYSHDTIQEVEEPESKPPEHKNVKEDTSENVVPPPKPEPTKEPVEVRQEDHIRRSPQQKELPEGNRERAVGGKTEKTTSGEGRVTSQRTNKREESHAGKVVKGGQREKESNRKDTADHGDKAERPAKEIPQVPSRPLSRQSTRKDGASPDTYKGEKLKSAIRKFQAKKDTRPTTRRSTDSKK